MTNPSVLTIILNFRTPDLTLQATEAALREMEGIPGDLTIVDNFSQDGSFETLSRAVEDRGWERVRVVQSGRNGGFGAGNNYGMREGLADGSDPDFYYVLNSDAWPDPGAIKVLRDFMMANPKAGLAGSHVRGPDDGAHQTAFRFPTASGEFEMAARTGVFSKLFKDSIVSMPNPEQTSCVDWVAGASLMLRREMLDQIGMFDETFFLYFEETDLCLRAARADWPCYYVPDSRIVHIGSASTGMKGWRRTPSYWFESRMHYFIKNHGRFYAQWATICRVAGCLVWKARRLVSNKPEADPEGFLGDLVSHAWAWEWRKAPQSEPAAIVTSSAVKDSK